MRKRKLAWYAPRWSYARRLIPGYRYVLRSISFARILAWSLLLSVAICGGLKAMNPELDLLILWRMPLALVFLPVMMSVQLLLIPLLFPPRVTVMDEKVRYWKGDSGWEARFEECNSFKLVVYSPTYRRLVFRYKGKRRSIGLAESVDLYELGSLLPFTAKVVDARHRFRTFAKSGRKNCGGAQ
jgi:hypothetical protein